MPEIAVAIPNDYGDPVREAYPASRTRLRVADHAGREAMTMTAVPDKAQRERGGKTLSGASLAAGAMMTISGSFSILMGVSGIAQDSLFAASSRYTYWFDLTTWGVIHLVVGVLLVITGLAVLADTSLGRGAGAAVVAISLITQFMFVPHYPAWAIPMMTLDLLILFALTRFHIEASGGR
ncbi:hypothetical protein [Streptomyces sp. MK5]|uniref:DUF7144 family membrane protein n=1 Tax=Streptomyces sp. MK5 TaxID=3064253 RepID=UPI002741C21F|nr:hypothetical protein [Streptomyces sp. MK5]